MYMCVYIERYLHYIAYHKSVKSVTDIFLKSEFFITKPTKSIGKNNCITYV